MGYVVYNTESTVLLNTHTRTYATVKAAKSARTRAANNGLINAADYSIASVDEFYSKIEKTVERTNLLSGEQYMESVNTPSYCSPASEAYWSA